MKVVNELLTSISSWLYLDKSVVVKYIRDYDYKELDEVKEELVKPFLNHVHDVIANKNEEVYKYISVWFASILQKPNFKTETAIVILGKQGLGKNVFTNVICKLMARYANENVTSIESVMGNFSAILENKKLLVLNELQSIDCNKYLNSDALKSVITDKKININQKNEPEKQYMVTKTSDERKGDFEYFDKLCDSFTPEFYENLFTFFMKMDIRNYNLRKVLGTDAKELIKAVSLSSYHLFAREHYEEIKNVTGPDLFNMYCDFVKKNKFNSCSSRTFISNIQEFTGK